MGEAATGAAVAASVVATRAAVVALAASAVEISEVAVQAATGKSQSVDGMLSGLVKRLADAFGTRLQAVILYGSAAMDDWQPACSDLNVLCVLEELGPRELAACEPVFRWWKDAGSPAPLLLTAEEVQTSTDCFPIEFHDMQEHRRVLHGVDIIADLVIDRSFYRAQVEHELRAKQIRLRQKAAEVLSSPDKLTKLLVDSLSTFCVLGRHALLLSGHEAHYRKADILVSLEQATGHMMPASHAVLALRSAAKPAGAADPNGLFESYLKEIGSLVSFVDALERKGESE